MVKKNLIMCFSSLRPLQFTYDELILREKNYDLALDWLFKSVPENWEIIYNDNTLVSIDDLVFQPLKEKLSRVNKLILHNDNHGEYNKGSGEHDMCKKCFSKLEAIDYEWVIYFTARHIIPNSGIFDSLISKYQEFDCVVSNPDFYYLSNFLKVQSASELYNDMLFAMKSTAFTRFIDFVDIELLKREHKGSEQHLFDFIKLNSDLKTIEIPQLGILRYDHQSYGWHLV
jgi:hypothetical protein